MNDDVNRAWKDQYMLRFPDGMRDTLKAKAAANNRSLNAEIIARLQSTLQRQSVSPLSAETAGIIDAMDVRAAGDKSSKRSASDILKEDGVLEDVVKAVSEALERHRLAKRSKKVPPN